MSVPEQHLGARIGSVAFRRTVARSRAHAIGMLIAVGACAHGGAAPSPESETSPTPHVFAIEKPALRRPDSPPPRYPKELLATGDTGTVVLRAIVEATGRVDPKSIEVVSSPHPAFTRAAIEALRESRFIPAEVQTPGRPGRLVSQGITMPIFFAPPPPAPPYQRVIGAAGRWRASSGTPDTRRSPSHW